MEGRADDVLLSLTRHVRAEQPGSTPTCFQYLHISKCIRKGLLLRLMCVTKAQLVKERFKQSLNRQ